MTLNVLSQIERYPEMFEHLFVDKLGNVTSDFVKNLQHIPDEDNSVASRRSIQILMSFLDTSKESELKDFLQFVTGSRSVTSNMAPGCIQESCVESESFFASTCLMELKIPNNFSSLTEFSGAFKAVLLGSNFTTASVVCT